MEVFNELVTILGGTTIAVTALAWLTRSLLTHWMSKDIERHKAQLASQNKLKIEKLRAELTRQTLEHEVQFRRVDERVAEHLAQAFFDFMRTCRAM